MPVVDMIDAVAQEVGAQGLSRVGVLGTRKVMESRFYGGLQRTTVLAPAGEELGRVHDAYAAMAIAGTVSPHQRAIFVSAADRLMASGAEAIVLGGTDLALVSDETSAPFPIIDCADIHATTLFRCTGEVE